MTTESLVPYRRSMRMRDLVNRKTIGSRIIPGDTVRGCTHRCLGCYAQRDARRYGKDFEKPVPCIIDGDDDPTKSGRCILRIGTSGEPGMDWRHSFKEAARFKHHFFWTKLVMPLPKDLPDHPVAARFAVTIDPLNENHAACAMKEMALMLDPEKTLVFIRIYQGSDILVTYGRVLMEKIQEMGFTCVAVPVRLLMSEIMASGLMDLTPSHELDYSREANLDLFVCGGQKSGKCRDCDLCFHFFMGHKSTASKILRKRSTRNKHS